MNAALAAGLDALTSLNLRQLREEWKIHYRSEAPSAMSPELLKRAIGFKIQEKALGGLNRRTQLRLSSLKSVQLRCCAILFRRALDSRE